MKRIWLTAIALMTLVLFTSCGYSGEKSHKGEVSVFYSDEKNEYVSGFKMELEKLFDSSGVKYSSYNAKGSEDSMEKQIEDALKNGAKALVVDVSDDDVAEHTVETAKQRDVPVIFFGTDVDDDTDKYSKAAFVDIERRDSDTDFEGAAKTVVKILDNMIKGDDRFKGIDSRYHNGNMTVFVPSAE